MKYQDLKLNPYQDLEEIDLRQEILDFIAGDDFGKEKWNPFIFRKRRYSQESGYQYCTCWNHASNEGRVGCADCDGEGILWDEIIIPGFIYRITTKSLASDYGFRENLGRAENSYLGFITPYDVTIRAGDHIMVPHLTSSGTFTHPITTDGTYFVNQARKLRLDFGGVEFGEAIMTRTK